MANGTEHLYFGHPAALKDPHLKDYFVFTDPIRAISDFADPRCIIVGKKGSGKTAVFLRLAESNGVGTLVTVAINQYSHELAAFQRAAPYSRFTNMFAFEILLEMLRGFLANPTARRPFARTFIAAVGVAASEYLQRFAGIANLAEMSIDTPIFGIGLARGANADEAIRLSGVKSLKKLCAKVGEITAKGVKFRVLIDDPDLLVGDVSQFLPTVGGLLTAAVDLPVLVPTPDVKVCVFVKQHKYDALSRTFEDFDHIRENAMSLTWSRAELIQMVAARVRYQEKLPAGANDLSCWSAAFAVSSEGELTKFADYLLPLLTNGPRDLITFCNLARRVAAQAQHAKITIEDFRAAEAEYSVDCLKEVEREYTDTYPAISVIVQKLFEHKDLRARATISRGVLEAALSERYRSPDIQELKRDVKWLASETGRGLVDVLFTVGVIGFLSKRSERLMSYSSRAAGDSVASARTFFVHPAYGRALGLLGES